MPEEIKVVADLDTTLFDNGVGRLQTAVARIKTGVADATKAPTAKPTEADGAEAGSNYLKGFLGKFLLRDAIRSIASGLSTVASDFATELASAFNIATPKGGWLAGFEQWIADGILGIVQTINPAVAKAMREQREKNIAQITSEKEQNEHDILYKEDPRTFGKSSGQANDELLILQRDLAAAQIRHQKYLQAKADFDAAPAPQSGLYESYGDFRKRTEDFQNRKFTPPPGADLDTAGLALIEGDLKKKIAQAEKEVGYAKEGESLRKADEKKETSFETKEAKEASAAAKKAAADEKRKTAAAAREQAKEAAKEKRDKAHAAAVEKNHEEHKLAAERAELSEKGPSKDLEFTREQLGHQTATSAVRIGGGMYGKNDSAASLVQHAATQISILRSIDAEIKQLRTERSDLTLL